MLCLSPFAPHLAEELWAALGHASSVANVGWPAYDPALCVDAQVEIAVQVNGKVRGRVTLARADPGVRAQLEGKTVQKVIYVPGRIVNLIAG